MKLFGWFGVAAVSLASCETHASPPQQGSQTLPIIAVPAHSSWRVAFQGIGPIRFGMTLKEASVALGESLSTPPDTESQSACWSTVVPKSAPPGVSFMVIGDTIVRVDVEAAGVATDDSVEVGWTTAQLEQRYGDGLEADHSLGGEPKFILASRDPERRYLIVFLTNGSRIISYRAGRRIAAQLEECD